MARTEVNSRLSEINKFLSDKSQEQEKEQQTREKVTQDLQADYAKRLQQSREELAQIKDDLQGTIEGNLRIQIPTKNSSLFFHTFIATYKFNHFRYYFVFRMDYGGLKIGKI